MLNLPINVQTQMHCSWPSIWVLTLFHIFRIRRGKQIWRKPRKHKKLCDAQSALLVNLRKMCSGIKSGWFFRRKNLLSGKSENNGSQSNVMHADISGIIQVEFFWIITTENTHIILYSIGHSIGSANICWLQFGDHLIHNHYHNHLTSFSRLKGRKQR